MIESHPLQPFTPPNARMLFLGSFPPPQARWSMEFFYPNWINDFWRIMGLIHYGDKTYFERHDAEKQLDRTRIMEFAESEGLAFYDTASKVRRLRGNASDEFLETIEPADIGSLLTKLPQCHWIVTTGGKASEELAAQFAPFSKTKTPKIGEYADLRAFGRDIRWWRMPSSSRAYPLKLEKKVAFYQHLFISPSQTYCQA